MAKEDKDWKKRLGTVYSTNEDYDYDYEEEDQQETLPPEKQRLKIKLDTKKRRGKTVTLVTGFIGSDKDLSELCTFLKKKCGTGGGAKEGEIIIQGDFRDRLREILDKEGYRSS